MFLAPWGRMRYRVGPRGALSTGDCYTYWYDIVIRSFVRVKKCVDDVLCWADTLEQLFLDTAFFLTHTNSFGIIQNPAKFKWGRRELEFLGFWIKEDGIKPMQDTIDAVKEFPRPSDITALSNRSHSCSQRPTSCTRLDSCSSKTWCTHGPRKCKTHLSAPRPRSQNSSQWE